MHGHRGRWCSRRMSFRQSFVEGRRLRGLRSKNLIRETIPNPFPPRTSEAILGSFRRHSGSGTDSSNDFEKTFGVLGGETADRVDREGWIVLKNVRQLLRHQG